MDREVLIASNALNRLQSYRGKWHVPIIRKFGHLYICYNKDTTLFTRSELLNRPISGPAPTSAPSGVLVAPQPPHTPGRPNYSTYPDTELALVHEIRNFLGYEPPVRQQ